MILLEPHTRDVGGFKVQRLLPAFPTRMIGPFIFFDHFGPVSFGPGDGADVRPHPHIGLATVTYLFEGAMMHRDSLGTVQRIEPGDVNWMTAGGGIVHSERSPPEESAQGHRLHGLQTWVALPRDREQAEPSFAHLPRATLPEVELPGVMMRLLAGSAVRRHGPHGTSPAAASPCPSRPRPRGRPRAADEFARRPKRAPGKLGRPMVRTMTLTRGPDAGAAW
jgi:redox-sensitive bicupin YhaK (pirin superfamily)